MRVQRVIVAALFAALATASQAAPVDRAGGRRLRINGYQVLELKGIPAQLGEQHGRLLAWRVRKCIQDLLLDGEAKDPETRREMIQGARVMDRYLEPEYREELAALAQAARVDYDLLVLLQLFGDVDRALADLRWRSYRSPTTSYTSSSPVDASSDPYGAGQCTSYAVFGPATADGNCIVGRNMDFWDHGVSEWGAVLVYFQPDRGFPFVTTSWAGIINGWTAMNVHGIVCANNTSFDGKHDSLEGLSTCFMVRKVVQYARTVEEGVQIVKSTPRACGTNLIVAGGDPPAAAIVEYDHDAIEVRWAEDGAVWAANDFQRLYQDEDSGWTYTSSRYSTLGDLIRTNYGNITPSMNFAAAPGVPIRSMNLHSALLFPNTLEFRVSMSKCPAADHLYRPFILTETGLLPGRRP